MQLSRQDKVLRALGRQTWMRGRDRIIRLFAHPDRMPAEPFEVDFFGIPYTGFKNDFIDWSVFYYGGMGLHELAVLGDLADALKARGRQVNFFDIGANIGQHTLYMTRHADRVFSFEPFPAVRDEMKRKLAHAGAGNVTIFPVALGDHDETGTFTPPTGANRGTGTLSDELPENASADTITVEVRHGDTLIQRENLPPISLMKLDVEGYGPRVLAGLRETLLRDRPPIVMEIQQDERVVSSTDSGTQMAGVLYPDHIIFDLQYRGGSYVLGPFVSNKTDEALVLPRELAGILPGTEQR